MARHQAKLCKEKSALSPNKYQYFSGFWVFFWKKWIFGPKSAFPKYAFLVILGQILAFLIHSMLCPTKKNNLARHHLLYSLFLLVSCKNAAPVVSLALIFASSPVCSLGIICSVPYHCTVDTGFICT